MAPARSVSLSRRSLKYDLELLQVRLQEPVLPGEDVLELTAAAAPMGQAPGTAAAAAAAAAAEDRERRAELGKADRPLDVLHDVDMVELLAFNKAVLREYGDDWSVFDEYLRALAENTSSKSRMRARLALLFQQLPPPLDRFDELTACDGDKQQQRCSLLVLHQAAEQARVTPDISSCIEQMKADLKDGPARGMLLELLSTYDDGLVTRDECVLLVSKLLHDSGRDVLLRKFTRAVGGVATAAAAAAA